MRSVKDHEKKKTLNSVNDKPFSAKSMGRKTYDKSIPRPSNATAAGKIIQVIKIIQYSFEVGFI